MGLQRAIHKFAELSLHLQLMKQIECVRPASDRNAGQCDAWLECWQSSIERSIGTYEQELPKLLRVVHG